MSHTTINETCSCGATLSATTEFMSSARALVTEWRETHKHAESAGICANVPPMLGPEGFTPPHCVLKAGHDGAHADGAGAHWTRRPESNPRPRIPLARRRA